MSPYVSELLTKLRSAEWMADTGIPLFATLLGLAITGLFVYWQLGSDRKLRRADHKRGAARGLGFALKRSGEKLSKLGRNDSPWGSPVWSDGAAIDDAVAEAAIVLPESDLAAIPHLVEAISDAWLACRNEGHKQDPDLAFHAEAVRRMLEPYAAWMLTTGKSLMAWDGFEAVPIRSSTDDVVSSALEGIEHEQRQQRFATTRSIYKMKLDRVSGKSGVVALTKRAGTTLNESLSSTKVHPVPLEQGEPGGGESQESRSAGAAGGA
jgi:hypothetical protein